MNILQKEWGEIKMASKNVWRTEKPKLEQHNANAADKIF